VVSQMLLDSRVSRPSVADKDLKLGPKRLVIVHQAFGTLLGIYDHFMETKQANITDEVRYGVKIVTLNSMHYKIYYHAEIKSLSFISNS
jgi:hypothetical protein